MRRAGAAAVLRGRGRSALLVGLSVANTHDSLALKPMVKGRRTRRGPHRGRYFKPQRLHAFQSCNLRQQVMPDPKPNSFGRYSHWMPVCSTKRMPHSTCQSGSGFRPGSRNRRSSA